MRESTFSEYGWQRGTCVAKVGHAGIIVKTGTLKLTGGILITYLWKGYWEARFLSKFPVR